MKILPGTWNENSGEIGGFVDLNHLQLDSRLPRHQVLLKYGETESSLMLNMVIGEDAKHEEPGGEHGKHDEHGDPIQVDVLTEAGAFWVFGGITILTFFFCLLFVPETKGKSLDDIQQLFRSPRPYFLEIGVWRLFGAQDDQRPILEEVY